MELFSLLRVAILTTSGVATVATAAIGAGLIDVTAALWESKAIATPQAPGRKEVKGRERRKAFLLEFCGHGYARPYQGCGRQRGYALITRRSQPNRIVDRPGELTFYMANLRDRRNHEDAVNDTADAPFS